MRNYLNIKIKSIQEMFLVETEMELLKRLKDKGIFWSYENIQKSDENIIIEHTLKYGDFFDIKELISLFGKEKVQKVWEKRMKYDKRFIKVNLLIARVFLDLDIQVSDLKREHIGRFKKRVSIT